VAIDRIAGLSELATRLADRAAVCDVETEGIRVRDFGAGRWYDTRPMLDEREHSPEGVDMLREAIAYALQRGLAQAHPHHPHMLCIVHTPA